MSRSISPIHTGTVNDKPVRFFRSPHVGPDMPWHAVNDLFTAIGMPRDLRRQQMRKLQTDWKRDVRMVDTEADLLMIAPHWMAQGMIGAMIQVGKATEALEVEYCRAGGKALDVLVEGISDAQERLCYVLDAWKLQGTHGEGA